MWTSFLVGPKDIQKESEQPACTGLTQLVSVVHVCAFWISYMIVLSYFFKNLSHLTVTWLYLIKFWHFLTSHFGPISIFDFGQINVTQKFNLEKNWQLVTLKNQVFSFVIVFVALPDQFFSRKKTKTKVKIHKWIIRQGDYSGRARWNNWRLTPSNPGGPRRVLSEKSRWITNRDSKAPYG